jgi:vitamin B12 transporter
VNGRVGYELPNRGELALVGRYSDGHRGIPFRTVFPDFSRTREQDNQFTLGSLEWRQPWVEAYDHALRLSLVRSVLTFRDPASEFERRVDIVNERREVDWLHHLNFGRLDTVTVGLEYRNEEGTDKGTFSRTTDTTAVFGQNELRLFDRLFLTGGVRYDHNSAFGDATTGRAAVSFLVKETDTRLKGSWAEGFRAPTFNELFFPGFGNPTLKPERSESYEVGGDQRLLEDRVRFGATFFHNQFNDLIQIVVLPGFIFQPQNVGRAISEGVEFYSEVSPVDWLTLSANYTYTESEDIATGKPLRRFPRHRWNTGATFTWDRLTLFGEAIVTTRQFETPTAATGQNFNPGYFRIDLGGSYKLWGRLGIMERIDLIARFNNITDERYTEVQGFPAPPFNALVGVRIAFQ